MPKGIPIYGDEFRKVRGELYLTQAKMAKALDMSLGGIQRIEGKFMVYISLDTIHSLSSLLRKDPEGVIDRLGVEPEKVEQIAADTRLPVDQAIPSATDDGDEAGARNIVPGRQLGIAAIPIFDRELAAGRWTEAIANDDDDIDAKTLMQGYFRVRLAGDSMEPNYPNGSIVEFQVIKVCSDGLAARGNYYIQRDDGLATFKHIASLDAEKVTLRALNRKKYPKPLVIERARIVRCARAVGKFIPD